MRFASPAEAIRRPEAHGTSGTMSKNQRIILPKSQWHPMIIAWEPDGTLDHWPGAQMAPQFLWFWSRWHPGSLSWSEKGALGSVPWSHKAPRDHSFGARWRPGSLSRRPKSIPGSLSGARMALRRPDGAPEAKSIHSSNLTSPEGEQPAPTRHRAPEPEPRRGVGGRINPPQAWGLGLVLVY